ncbi:MAG: hypothetical protein ACSLE1_02280 [Sphingobium sp.]
MVNQELGFARNLDNDGSRCYCCGEHRKSDQVSTNLHMVEVQCELYGGWAQLQDISNEFMMLRHKLPIYLGDEIKVRITGTYSVEGTVFWASRHACGLRLVRSLDSEALQTQWLERKLHRTFQPVPLLASAAVATHSEDEDHLPAKENNFSQNGEPTQKQARFVEGLPVKVVLGAGHDREGILRWSKEGVAGIHLREHQNAGL